MSEWDRFPRADAPAPQPGAPDLGMDAYPVDAPASQLNEIDRETGAGARARFAVSLAETPQDRLAAARQFYPDAQLVVFGRISGGERLNRQTGTAMQVQGQPGEEHIVFTHPDTGKPTTFNARGMDWGDVAEFGVEGARALAYTGGAGLAAWLSGGNPAAMAAGGTAASQGVKYLAEPVVELVTGLKIPDSRTPGQRIKEGLADVGMELGGAFGGELTGATLRRLNIGPRATPLAVEKRAILKGLPPGQGRPGVLKAVEQMAVEQGVPKDKAVRGALPLATRSETVRSFFQAASKYPRSAETINEALDDTYGVINRAFERTQRGIGSGVREKGTAGQVAQWGLKNYAQATKATQKGLEDTLEKVVGGKTGTPMGNTMALIDSYRAKLPPGAKPGSIMPADYVDLAKVVEANDGALPFEYVRAFRETLGEATSGGLIAPTGAKTKWYDPLYSALTADMEGIAKSAGKPAEAAWNAAQKHWAQREARLELLRQVANAPTAERAFRAAMSGADDGPTLLTALKASVPKDAWDDVVSVKLWDMGATARGADVGDEVAKQFSPTRFIGNWRAMSDASKDVLFERGSRIRAELNRLADVTAALGESRAAGSGRIGASGTPQGNVFMEMLGDGGLSGILTEGKMGMARRALDAANPLNRARRANRQALLLTDPDFVRWLADGGSKPPTPAGTAAHLRRLSGGAFAAKPPGVRQALLEYLEDWSGTLQQGGAEEEQP